MEEVIETNEGLTPEEEAFYNDKISFAKDLLSLATTNVTFQRLVKEYTEDFAVTSLNNVHQLNEAGVARFVEKFKARSHFLNFLQETIEDGRKASFDLNDGKEQF